MRSRQIIVCAVIFLCCAAVSPARAQSGAESLFIEAQKSLARGDDAGAEALLKAALAEDRAFVSALWQLSQIYESRGQMDAARDALTRGLEIDPGASWARERLARIDGRIAETRRAEEARRRRAEEDRRAARIERLAEEARRALAGTGSDRYAAAGAALERLLEEDPENAWAAEELRRLEPPPPAPLPADTAARVARAPAPDTAAAIAPAATPAAAASPVRAASPPRRLLAPLLLVAAIALLALDLRRRAPRREHPLQGSTSLVPVIDVVTLLCRAGGTGVLAIERGDASGEIYVEKGEVVHARCEGLAGKKAFQKLVEGAPGRFHFRNHLPTVRRTITEPLSVLLLSARPRDEARPAADPKPSGREPAGLVR